MAKNEPTPASTPASVWLSDLPKADQEALTTIAAFASLMVGKPFLEMTQEDIELAAKRTVEVLIATGHFKPDMGPTVCF